MPGLKPKADREPARPKEPRKPRPHGFARARMTPTHRVEHVVEQCPDCGTQLSGGWAQRTRGDRPAAGSGAGNRARFRTRRRGRDGAGYLGRAFPTRMGCNAGGHRGGQQVAGKAQRAEMPRMRLALVRVEAIALRTGGQKTIASDRTTPAAGHPRPITLPRCDSGDLRVSMERRLCLSVNVTEVFPPHNGWDYRGGAVARQTTSLCLNSYLSKPESTEAIGAGVDTRDGRQGKASGPGPIPADGDDGGVR